MRTPHRFMVTLAPDSGADPVTFWASGCRDVSAVRMAKRLLGEKCTVVGIVACDGRPGKKQPATDLSN